MTDPGALSELLALADRVVSPAVLVTLVLIYTKLSAAIDSITRLESTLERTIVDVGKHSRAIAKLEGWLEAHEERAP